MHSAAGVSQVISKFSEGEYLWKIRKVHRMEVEAGDLAKKQSSNRQVKDFGETLVRDHQKGLKDLEKWSSDNKVSITEPKAEGAVLVAKAQGA